MVVMPRSVAAQMPAFGTQVGWQFLLPETVGGPATALGLRVEFPDPAQSSAGRKSLARFRELIEMLRQMAREGRGPADLARSVLEQTGYAQTLKDEDSVEADARLENLQEVLGSMVEFEREAEEPTLNAFLELVTLQTDADRGDDGDAITLMTVHAAKGLEFPAVMVAGLEEETFPHRGLSPDDDPEDLEEERRLAYVAFTRAKQRLFLSYAKTRRVYGEVRFRRPSRFLDEMPPEELERVGAERPEPRWGRRPEFSSRPTPAISGTAPALRGGASLSPRPQSVPGDSHVDRLEASDPEGIELHLGMRVRHQKFGVGQVRALTPGSPPRVTVSFPGWGDKTLVSSYLEPA